MANVLILVDVETGVDGVARYSSELTRMVDALRQAIAASNPEGYTIQVVSSNAASVLLGNGCLVCPLTLHVPEQIDFMGQAIYRTCREVEGLRQWVQRQGKIAIGEGDLWLPIALTAKGPLYGEVIATTPSQFGALTYHQPLHLPDRLRQPLYLLGGQLLRAHQAPPAVYLLQFGIHHSDIYFDRLFPFPAAPAIASISVQIPNLFMAHWLCLTEQPLQDLAIPGSIPYLVLHP